ncbi:MAG: ABC transporter permease subunit [Oscillospiraceae bacterium]|nr:ABC transporter permease subunit [Oscillospiraceae bacterium]
MVFRFQDFLDCLRAGALRVPDTMYAVLITLLLGLIFGTLFALLLNGEVPAVSKVVSAVFTVLRGIPPTLLFIVIRLLYSTVFAGFIAAHDFGFTIRDIDIMYVGIFSMFVFALPIITESVRGALLSVTRDQYEAGYSIGLSPWPLFRRVILPQMIPAAVPVLVNNFIILLKTSALLFLIGVVDIWNGALEPAHLTYGYFEAYVAAAVIYYVIFFVAEQLGIVLEKIFRVEKRTAGRKTV